MRIWSLHPKYLDAKGLVALWREALLARNVLENKTRGYKNHPQLNRFRSSQYPVDSINQYLKDVYTEAENRGYEFRKKKIGAIVHYEKMPVTKGQILFETGHLLSKLKKRDQERFAYLSEIKDPDPHPLFFIIEGETESWEKLLTEDIQSVLNHKNYSNGTVN